MCIYSAGMRLYQPIYASNMTRLSIQQLLVSTTRQLILRSGSGDPCKLPSVPKRLSSREQMVYTRGRLWHFLLVKATPCLHANFGLASTPSFIRASFILYTCRSYPASSPPCHHAQSFPTLLVTSLSQHHHSSPRLSFLSPPKLHKSPCFLFILDSLLQESPQIGPKLFRLQHCLAANTMRRCRARVCGVGGRR